MQIFALKNSRREADRREAELVAERAEYPLGKVAPEDRERIFANGLLNDVATCLWIKGRSHEELGRLAEARQAYEQATHLTHGRCWNEDEELFWSPAEKAR